MYYIVSLVQIDSSIKNRDVPCQSSKMYPSSVCEVPRCSTGAMLSHEELRWQLLSSSMMVHLLPILQEVAQDSCSAVADAIRRSASLSLPFSWFFRLENYSGDAATIKALPSHLLLCTNDS